MALSITNFIFKIVAKSNIFLPNANFMQWDVCLSNKNIYLMINKIQPLYSYTFRGSGLIFEVV